MRQAIINFFPDEVTDYRGGPLTVLQRRLIAAAKGNTTVIALVNAVFDNPGRDVRSPCDRGWADHWDAVGRVARPAHQFARHAGRGREDRSLGIGATGDARASRGTGRGDDTSR